VTLSDRFLAEQYRQGFAATQLASGELEQQLDKLPTASSSDTAAPAQPAQNQTPESQGFLSRNWQSTVQGLQSVLPDPTQWIGRLDNYRAAVTAALERMSGLPDHLMRLIAIFVIETLIIPLGTGLALLFLCRQLLADPEPSLRRLETAMRRNPPPVAS
jgi:hypothetical protein